MGEFTGRAPHQLSLGQRRRVAIASVLAMDPSLLVLDEPSANLDPRTRRELIETLDAVERTMLVVTHDLPLAARLCERAVLLSAGRIVADGPARELLADEQLLAAHDLELLRVSACYLARLVWIPSSSFCIGTMKASMPSRNSRAVTSSRSIPASASAFRSAVGSSAAVAPVTPPSAPAACRTGIGIVLTVFGPTRPQTYSVAG